MRAKKYFKRIFIIVFNTLILLSLTACSACIKGCVDVITAGRARFKSAIKNIEPETDYSFIAISEKGIKKGTTYRLYNDMAKEYEKGAINEKVYSVKRIDNTVYFLSNYGKTGYYNDLTDINNYTFYVGFFKVDIDTLSCELIYDFHNIYPLSRGNIKDPKFLHVYSKDVACLIYNGDLQIFDINKREIVESINIYNKKESRKNNFNYCGFNEYGDYYFNHLNGKVDYYELDGYHFKHHTFDVDPKARYVIRFEDNVFASEYVYIDKSLDCFNLKTEERYDDFDSLLDAYKEHENTLRKQKRESYIYTLDDKKYHFGGISDFCIYDENDNEVNRIDISRLEENKTYNKLCEIASHKQFRFASYKIVENKLFVIINARAGYVGAESDFYFEYDIKNDTFKYLGYMWSDSEIFLVNEEQNTVS